MGDISTSTELMRLLMQISAIARRHPPRETNTHDGAYPDMPQACEPKFCEHQPCTSPGSSSPQYEGAYPAFDERGCEGAFDTAANGTQVHISQPAPDTSREHSPPTSLPYHGHNGRWRILSVLCEEDGINQKALSERINIRPQSLTEALIRLESEGLIQRRPNAADKRETLLFITTSGREKRLQIQEARRRFDEAFFAPLSDEEKQTLAGILRKIINARR